MLTKKQRAYIETWLDDHDMKLENGLDEDMALRAKRWLYEEALGEQSPNNSLDNLRASVHDDISQMAWEELGEAIEALKRL